MYIYCRPKVDSDYDKRAGWDFRQTIPMCSQSRAYGPRAKGGVTSTENLEG